MVLVVISYIPGHEARYNGNAQPSAILCINGASAPFGRDPGRGGRVHGIHHSRTAAQQIDRNSVTIPGMTLLTEISARGHKWVLKVNAWGTRCQGSWEPW